MEFGTRIKKVRELRNYSQEYMAERLGISQVSYSRIETGQTRLSLNRFQIIARILEIDMLVLLEFDENILFKNCKRCDKLVQSNQSMSVKEWNSY